MVNRINFMYNATELIVSFRFYIFLRVNTGEGVQNRPFHDVLLWPVDDFELKAIETLQAHDKLLPLP